MGSWPKTPLTPELLADNCLPPGVLEEILRREIHLPTPAEAGREKLRREWEALAATAARGQVVVLPAGAELVPAPDILAAWDQALAYQRTGGAIDGDLGGDLPEPDAVVEGG